jgi:adenylate cyclase
LSEKAYLELKDNKETRRLMLPKQSTMVGRSPEADMVLPFPQISRLHARIYRQGEQYFIEDNNSVNGTFVNDKPVKTHLLRDGDVIRLGAVTVGFRNPASARIHLSDEYLTDANMTISVPITQFALTARKTAPLQQRDPREMVQVIFNAAKALVGSLDLDAVLSGVMDLVFEYLKADRGFLMLYDEEQGQLVPYVIKQRKPGGKSDKPINFSRTIVNKVFEEGVAIVTANAMSDSRFGSQESIVMQQIRSCMCVPLWDEKKIIGIIYVDCQIFESFFQERDLDLLSTIAIISAIAIGQSRLNQAMAQAKRIRERLERYHSPSVVNRIIGAGEDASLRTEEREITVLFADLVGFTPMTEHLDPTEVARILNCFFTAVTEVIFQNEGTLDKYIGDAVMAVFGVPFSQPDHAVRAVKSAMEMFRALEEINASGELPNRLQMRIGVNSGRVVAGDIGSEKRVDYTVLGSTVNIASRIESSVAKSGDIVIGEATKALVGDRFPTECLGAMPLRGVTAPITLYRILWDQA